MVFPTKNQQKNSKNNKNNKNSKNNNNNTKNKAKTAMTMKLPFTSKIIEDMCMWESFLFLICYNNRQNLSQNIHNGRLSDFSGRLFSVISDYSLNTRYIELVMKLLSCFMNFAISNKVNSQILVAKVLKTSIIRFICKLAIKYRDSQRDPGKHGKLSKKACLKACDDFIANEMSKWIDLDEYGSGILFVLSSSMDNSSLKILFGSDFIDKCRIANYVETVKSHERSFWDANEQLRKHQKLPKSYVLFARFFFFIFYFLFYLF